MKYLSYLAMALFAICITSCGNGGTITPTQKKVNGPLGKYFEVVERDYKINDDALSVELKRIAEGGPTDASWSSRPTFLVELQDEDGNTISTKNTDVVFTKEQLESVFSLNVDETASITFKFDKTKGVAKFKVSSKWDADNVDESSNTGLDLSDGSYVFDGLWQSVKHNSQPCRIAFEKRGDNLYDSKYVNLKFNATIPMKGSIEGDSLFFEGVIQGKPFTIHLSGNEDHLSGTGNDYAHSDLNVRVVLNKEGTEPVIDEDDDDDESTSSSSDSEDWDALLDSYEKYVDKYIAYAKKAAKGDMSALSEYTSLMEQAQEYSEKLQNAKGDMSAAQWARYNKITMKMANAAQEMQ